MATGAHRSDRVRAFVAHGVVLTVVMLAVPAAVLYWRPGLWLGLFTDDASIRAIGADYFRLVGPTYPLVGISMVIALAFQGLGRPTMPLVWMAVRVAGVLAAAIFCTQRLGLGHRAVFAAIAVANVVSAAVMTFLFALVERRPRPVAAQDAIWKTA
jgi:Na+-driven multidrug efflux pump